MSHLLQTFHNQGSKGKRSLSLHRSLQRSRAFIMQFKVQNSILHPSCVSQFITHTHLPQWIINKNIWKSRRKSVLRAHNYCLFIKIFAR